MIASRHTCLALIVVLSPLMVDTSYAQFKIPSISPRMPDPSRIDPTNPGSLPRQAIREIDQFGTAFDRARNDLMQPNPRAGRDYGRLHFVNETGREIRIAVLYRPFIPPHHGTPSQLSSSGTGGSGGRDKKYWYYMQPGQSVYIGDTNEFEVYYYAQDKRGAETTGPIKDKVEGRDVGFTRAVVFPRSPDVHVSIK